MIPIKEIESAKNITLKTENKSFSNASAIYTYLLTLHKKVTLVKCENIENNFSFLPWYDRLRELVPVSADLVLEVSDDTIGYFNFLIENDQKINKKMATALYAGLLQRYENFQNSQTDGIVFAVASELIKLQAEYELCHDFLMRRAPLALFRLKAILFQNMLLTNEARCVELYFSDEDLNKTGATMQEVDSIMKELLTLVNVQKVLLIKSDENNRIIREERRFEK